MKIFVVILFILFFTLQAIVAFYLLLPFFLLVIHFLFAEKKQLIGKKYKKVTEKEFDFAAIITAHKDTRFIKPLVDSFLKQTYHQFVVYVVADDCDIADLQFDDVHIKVLKPEPAFHAKIKSIKYAVEQFIRKHDVLIVFDSDNLVHPDYLQNLNRYFQCGFRAVQTHMLSKNFDTIYSKLDSIGHIYNTFTERQSRMELGLSSSILGLGIAIDTELYQQVMYKDALGGFDKKLQADVIQIIPQLAFAADAIVYDEKVDDGYTLEKQRTRWIYTYFKYFAINKQILINGIKQLNFNRFFFGLTTLRPPLFITVGAAFLFMIAGYFIHPAFTMIWAGILFLFVLAFVLIVITQSRQKGMGKALLYLPVIVWSQMMALLKIRKAKKDFLKTEHAKVIYIDDLLKNEPA
jgi:cellulose synthase/poly-beta-1,6-N-acetylglucosamine synthase-like glycosyltransferase